MTPDLISSPIIIVTPVYEDTEASVTLFTEIKERYGTSAYLVAVDDGSVAHPLSADLLQKYGIQGSVITLCRNVGHQGAIAIGLSYVAERMAEHQRVVIMDSDGEDRPESIQPLLDQLDLEETDVVVASRKSRVETLRFKAFYVLYKLLFRALTGREISFGNFMALSERAVKRLVVMQEMWIHVAAAVLVSKLRVGQCLLDRGQRYTGQSRMNFLGLVLHGFRGLMVTAEDVLIRVGMACAVVATASVLAMVVALLLKLTGFATPGWFSVTLGILVLMFLQVGALTLMMLMLTGVVRSGNIVYRQAYTEFIDAVAHTDSQPVKAAS